MKFMEVLMMYICVIVSTVDVNDCIFCVNEQQKVYLQIHTDYVTFLFEKRFLRKECKEHYIVSITALVISDKFVLVVLRCY